MRTINQHVVIDRINAPPFDLFFEGTTIDYAIDLGPDAIEAILQGEYRLREVLEGAFTGSLTRKLMEDLNCGIRDVNYGGTNERFVYITLSVQSMTPENFYRIGKTIADHIDYCKAATALLPAGEDA